MGATTEPTTVYRQRREALPGSGPRGELTLREVARRAAAYTPNGRPLNPGTLSSIETGRMVARAWEAEAILRVLEDVARETEASS